MRRCLALLAALPLAAPVHAQTLDELMPRIHADTTGYRAYDALSELLEAQPDNVDARAWKAEVLLRMEDGADDAAKEARAVLQAAPCHAMAHNALAAAHLRMPEPGALDSAWTHAAAAVECDPADGNAWLTYADAALRRGDDAAEARALRRLGELAFFPEPALELARWMLAAAPRDAVLFAGMDDDWAALRVAQLARGVRTDVTVVRLTHLGMPAYARRMAAATGYPVPPAAEATHEGAPVYRDGPSALQLALGQAWARARLEDGNPRPLALTPFADQAFIRDGPALSLQRRDGPVVTVNPFGRLGDPLQDTAAFTAAWARLDVAKLDGPLVSEGDRSAVRRNGLHPSEVVVLLLAVHAEYRAEHEDPQGARQALGWAQQVVDTGRPRPDAGAFVDEIRGRIP
jgi:tetratricopeptide (TPR) repeat protein